MPGEPRRSRRQQLRPVAHLAICDGTAALSGLKRGPHNVELHPLVVVFNAANELNPPQLLFLRIDEARRELVFSKLPNAERSRATRVLPLKALVALHVKSKHVFELTLRHGPPIRLEAHDAFVSRSNSLAPHPIAHPVSLTPSPSLSHRRASSGRSSSSRWLRPRPSRQSTCTPSRCEQRRRARRARAASTRTASLS